MSSFTDLVKALNKMETTDTVETTTPTDTNIDPNISAMKSLLESVDKVDEAPKQLKGKDKLKTVKPGEADGTTKNPSKGKLVGEEKVSEDLLGQLKKEFTDLLVTKEEQQTTEDENDSVKHQKLIAIKKQVVVLDDMIDELYQIDMKDGTTGQADLHDQIATMDKGVKLLRDVIDRAHKVVPETADVEEAVGEFADPIYDLMDQLGVDANHPILDELIRYLDGDTIKGFVADYKRHHEVPDNDRDVSDAPYKD